MNPVPELNDLVSTVSDRCPGGSELDRLRAASDVAREVGRLGEDLVTHYVDEARAAGASWADIGDVLGVSRQGAHQRHHDRPRPERWWQADLGRWSREAKWSIRKAVKAAFTAGNTFVGPEHMLLGLLDTSGNSATATLTDMGIDPDNLAADVRSKLLPAGEAPADVLGRPFGRGAGWPGERSRGGPGHRDGRRSDDRRSGDRSHDAGDRGGRGGGADGRGMGRVPFTASARRVFDLASGEAGGSPIGASQLLVALAQGGSIAATALQNAGATPEHLREALEQTRSRQS